VQSEQLHLLRFRDGRLVGETVYFDLGGLMQQLKP
jgi:hypothetical protein